MKYLENYKSFESVDSLKTKLTKDFIFNIEDIFLEILDENDINCEKSYFDIESESWNKVENLYDAPDDAFSISIYFSNYFIENKYKPFNYNVLSQIIECIKRSVIYYESLSINNVVGYNIQYRSAEAPVVVRAGVGHQDSFLTDDIDIKIDNIDSLLKDIIRSIDITFYTI
jgi:hypothetical protein